MATKTFKMNNVNKVMFVNEFTMKMRDAKVIYALRKIVEKELKISWYEYISNHLDSVENVKNLFSDVMKFFGYKRNANLVKITFDLKKIDSSWRKVVEKLVNPTTESVETEKKVSTASKKPLKKEKDAVTEKQAKPKKTSKRVSEAKSDTVKQIDKKAKEVKSKSKVKSTKKVDKKPKTSETVTIEQEVVAENTK